MKCFPDSKVVLVAPTKYDVRSRRIAFNLEHPGEDNDAVEITGDTPAVTRVDMVSPSM